MTMLTGDFTHDSAVAGHHPDAAEDRRSADLPDDARLYLRHVEKGESIRSLARELGCHASTILRRIRKFEARRDDPLIDRALDRGTDGARLDEEQILRALRRLAEPGALLAVAEGMDKAIVTRDGIRTAIIQRHLAESMALNGWVAQIGSGRIMSYAIVPAGREALRSMMNRAPGRALPRGDDFHDAEPVGDAPEGDIGPEAAQRHRIWEERTIRDPDDDRRRRARVNIAESPLLVLARRRDNEGRPFLTPGQVAAGERLREDFELAQMGPRVTQNWDRFMTSGIDVSRSAGGYRGGSDSARDRVATALRDLGPGMGDIVLRVCCFLEGIELTERRLGWSARSGKIVLRLALM
ncbi:MAG: DUF6456 domain-containing protein, partial [Paracoccus sp. (in: a-proteobacteria)]|nr:DUF6456 domain-containing protein [Paracoccus sp. (in: a-proteobacteria)]